MDNEVVFVLDTGSYDNNEVVGVFTSYDQAYENGCKIIGGSIRYYGNGYFGPVNSNDDGYFKITAIETSKG